MLKKVEDYNLKLKRKGRHFLAIFLAIILIVSLNKLQGVCYMSRVPPYMKATYVRKLLESYGVERIYLAVEGNQISIFAKFSN